LPRRENLPLETNAVPDLFFAALIGAHFLCEERVFQTRGQRILQAEN
jgi:hypothetical protein